MIAKAFDEFLERLRVQGEELHGLRLEQDGTLLAEGYAPPFGPDRPHVLWSLSKTFTAAAIGFLRQERGVDLDDRVVDVFSERAPADPSPLLRAMRVRHLLTMSTGHTVEPWPAGDDDDWVRAILAGPVEREPGTHFLYNSTASYLLSSLVTRRTGLRVRDYLMPRLFAPLGITEPTWTQAPNGDDVGGWGLSLRLDEVARFGRLWLQDGGGVLPPGWVQEASQAYVSTAERDPGDWNQGYGYQMWRGQHGSFRADGAFGQFMLVMPAQRALLTTFGSVMNLQLFLNAVWTHLLPLLNARPAVTDPHRPVWEIPGPPGTATPGSHAGRFTGNGVELSLAPVSGGLRMEVDGTSLESAPDVWRETTGDPTPFGLPGDPGTPLAARGAWTDPDRYRMEIRLPESSAGARVELDFEGDALRVRRTLRGLIRRDFDLPEWTLVRT